MELLSNTNKKQEDKPHYTGHRARLKERFLANPRNIPDYELVEMLLFASSPRKDVKPLAKKLLQEFGDFASVINAEITQLRSFGLNDTAIASLKTVKEAASRQLLGAAKEEVIINSSVKLVNYCRAEMGFLKSEQFRILFLNSKNKLIADEVQNEGTMNHTVAYPREVVKRALELGASSIILSHNHPSGDPMPSEADLTLTEKITAAAQALGIDVHDHLIIAKSAHFSFRDRGLI